MAPRTIVLATDLSHRCDRALDRATMLAAGWRARLVALHVTEHPEPVTDLPSWRRQPDGLQAARQRILADLQGAEAVDVEVQVERGDPATRIVEVAERVHGDLIVTGVARDETLGRILLGTTVEKLMRTAAMPVLVVKSRPRAPYGNVVVATDFSPGSRQALEATLALLPDARVTLFHAFTVPYEERSSDRMAAREAAARAAEAEAQAFLADTPAVAASGRPVATLCEHGDPGPLLDDLVHARGVDLVVVGTEGRSGLAGMLLGSVARRLLGGLSVDVLVVRRRRA
jgi:nucleotide-binding universal stress UspA family protein